MCVDFQENQPCSWRCFGDASNWRKNQALIPLTVQFWWTLRLLHSVACGTQWRLVDSCISQQLRRSSPWPSPLPSILPATPSCSPRNSLTSMTWSGSAFLGGLLSDARDYRCLGHPKTGPPGPIWRQLELRRKDFINPSYHLHPFCHIDLPGMWWHQVWWTFSEFLGVDNLGFHESLIQNLGSLYRFSLDLPNMRSTGSMVGQNVPPHTPLSSELRIHVACENATFFVALLAKTFSRICGAQWPKIIIQPIWSLLELGVPPFFFSVPGFWKGWYNGMGVFGRT